MYSFLCVGTCIVFCCSLTKSFYLTKSIFFSLSATKLNNNNNKNEIVTKNDYKRPYCMAVCMDFLCVSLFFSFIFSHFSSMKKKRRPKNYTFMRSLTFYIFSISSILFRSFLLFLSHKLLLVRFGSTNDIWILFASVRVSFIILRVIFPGWQFCF